MEYIGIIRVKAKAKMHKESNEGGAFADKWKMLVRRGCKNKRITVKRRGESDPLAEKHARTRRLAEDIRQIPRVARPPLDAMKCQRGIHIYRAASHKETKGLACHPCNRSMRAFHRRIRKQLGER